MHEAAYQWAETWTTGHWSEVLEVGSRYINGSIRQAIDAGTYLGCDLYPGPGVDIIADARTLPYENRFDLVVCLEVLEHDSDPRSLIDCLGRFCKPGGRVVATAGGTGRAPHSAHDGGPLHDSEHYANLDETHFDVPWGDVLASEIKDTDWRVCWQKHGRW